MKFTTSLKKNHEFRRLYNKGKSAASHCAVVYCRRNGSKENRLGITVSTKIGGAVQRNRVRRRLKEIYRLNEKKILSGYSIVIVARMKSRFVGFAELESSVLGLFRKLNLLADGQADKSYRPDAMRSSTVASGSQPSEVAK